MANSITFVLLFALLHEATCYNAQQIPFQTVRGLPSRQRILHSPPVSPVTSQRRPQPYYYQPSVKYANTIALNTWNGQRTNAVPVVRYGRRDPRLKTSTFVNSYRQASPVVPVMKPSLRIQQQQIYGQNRKRFTNQQPWVRSSQPMHRLQNGRYFVQKGQHSKQYFTREYNLRQQVVQPRLGQQPRVLLIDRIGLNTREQQRNQIRQGNKLPFEIQSQQRYLLQRHRQHQRQQLVRRLGVLQPSQSKEHPHPDFTHTPWSRTTIAQPSTTSGPTVLDVFPHQDRSQTQSRTNVTISKKDMDKLHLGSMLRIEVNVLSKYDPEMRPGQTAPGVIETVKYVRGPQHGVIKSTWAYHKDVEHIGPEEWARIYPTCKGVRQSPVDIRDFDVMYTSELSPFKFTGFDGTQSTFKMHNNGHTASITVSDNMKVEGGGLEGEYATANIHFHWSRDHEGSEHAVNGIKFPLEMHIVNYATRYGNLTNAMRYRDGLAVFAVFFTVRRTYNPYFRPIEDGLRRCQLPGSSAELDKINVETLIPRADSEFYRYYGSLTTPPCHQSVIWTLFDDIQVLSESQVGALQSLLESYSSQQLMFPSNTTSSPSPDLRLPTTISRTHYITSNYRYLQRANNRVILTNIKHYMGKTAPPKNSTPAPGFHPNMSDQQKSDSPVPKPVVDRPSHHYILYF